jgi:hypothetical protein
MYVKNLSIFTVFLPAAKIRNVAFARANAT